MKKFLMPLVPVVVFLACQALVTVVMVVAKVFCLGDGASFAGESVVGADSVGYALLLSGVLAVAVLYRFGLIHAHKAFCPNDICLKDTLCVIAGVMACAFALNIVSEMAELPDNLSEQMMRVVSTPQGVLAVAVVGPIVEELVFREAMIGGMLRTGFDWRIAVGVSSICFGIAHGNPAQIPFAMALGVVFGIVYLNRGSIVLTSLCHIINNSLAVIQLNVMGQEVYDFRFADMLGGVLPALGVAVMLIGLGTLFLKNDFRRVRRDGNAMFKM